MRSGRAERTWLNAPQAGSCLLPASESTARTASHRPLHPERVARMVCFCCGNGTPVQCGGGCNRDMCDFCAFTCTSVGQLMCADCAGVHQGLPAPPPHSRKRLHNGFGEQGDFLPVADGAQRQEKVFRARDCNGLAVAGLERQQLQMQNISSDATSAAKQQRCDIALAAGFSPGVWFPQQQRALGVALSANQPGHSEMMSAD